MSIAEVSKLLKLKGHTISVAESCTGGSLAHEITKASGATTIFLGGVVTYANAAKTKILSVPKDLLLLHGAVSEPVALLMAQSAHSLFGSTWALSTTGYAGPNGGTPQAPVGTVWIGLCGPNVHQAHRFYFENSSRDAHTRQTINKALEMLLGALLLNQMGSP